MDLDRKRWSVVLAGICANLCSGSAYAFSVYKGPLKELLGCPETQLALAFSLSIAFLPVGMLLSGKIADQRSPRMIVALGGLVFGGGMVLASFSRSLGWLYATYGVMMSTGNGAAYGAVIAAAVKWFPDRRGLASGMVVGALGVGTVVIAPLAQRIIDSPGLGIVGAFRILGTAFVVLTLAASRFVINPPAGYSPSKFVTQDSEEDAESTNLTWGQMIRRPRFWLLHALYVAGAFSGLMVVSQASPIAQEITGLTAAQASLIVSVLGLANASGRLFWGGISDRIGRFEALALMFAVTAAVMFSLNALAAEPPTLVAAIALIALCYGGYLGIFPSLCADSFGSRNLAVNYGVLFSAFSLAGVLGPFVVARLKDAGGGYGQAFVVAGSVAALGLSLSLGARARST